MSVAPPRGATGKLNRAGYAVLGVGGLVVATAFAAIAELAGPGVSTTAGGTGFPGGQGTSPAGVQLVPGNAVPGGPMTVSGSPIPGAPSGSTPPPTTVTSVGPDGKETTSVITPPPPPPAPNPNPGPGPGPGPNPDPSPTKLPPSSTKTTPPTTPPPTTTPKPSTENPPTTTTTGGGGSSSSGAPDSSPGRFGVSGTDTSTSAAR
ncbi:hypothetical protein [Amycolatopsis coloradensis]|uniref:hypothetical protein n=1 Tax=Amycolatopsis coloradensis TaxID=76021 RepID=UPI001301253A|nr:hypothetical protein [Amycolatopsis coloradensis]